MIHLKVKPLARLVYNMEALTCLLDGSVSRKVVARIKKIWWVRYGMGDVSVEGCEVVIHIEDKLRFCYGQWIVIAKQSSFDYKELRNLLEIM